MHKKKKKVLIIVISALLTAMFLFFAFIIFILVQAIGSTSEIIVETVVGEIAEGVVSGLAEGGKDIAESIITESVSTILGGIN